MDIYSLWLAFPDLKVKLLALAMAAQMVLTFTLYRAMSKARFAAVKAGKATVETYKIVGSEPDAAGIYTRAIGNQYEIPVLFYVVIVGSIALGSSSWITVILAAIFVIARVLHAREMIGPNDVLKRRKLFIRSAQVFILMLVEFVISALIMAQG